MSFPVLVTEAAFQVVVGAVSVGTLRTGFQSRLIC